MPDQLETRLRALAADAVWPPTPDLQAAVAARLAEGAAPERPRHARRWARGRPARLVAAVLAALVLIPAAGAVAFPDARDDVLEWLGLRNVEVRRVPAPPPSARPEREDDLGRVVTLAAARREAGFTPGVPAALGAPDRVRIVARRVSLVYDPRPGLPALEGSRAGAVLTQTPGGVRGEYLQKMLLGGTRAEVVDVRGRPGVFISGGRHVYLYEAPDGSVREDRALFAGPTLIWVGGGYVFRLELKATRAKALEIARSVTT